VKGRQILRTLILLPLMTPPITVAVMWQLLLMPKGGWLNSFLMDMALFSQPVSFLGSPTMAFPFVCLADVWQWTPFIALMTYAALQTLPEDIYEAAKLDGASGPAMFWSITLPMLAPALTTVRQPTAAMGELAVQSLLKLIANGSAKAEQHILPVELIARGSTGPKPRA